MFPVSIDFYKEAIAKHSRELGIINSFKLLWGTETIDGVEVLREKLYFYPTVSNNAKKLLEMLGMYKEIESSSKQGVTSMWLYFNPNKNSTDEFNDEIIADKINEILPLDESKEYVLAIGHDYPAGNRTFWRGNYGYRKPKDEFWIGLTSSELQTEIETNYESIFENYIVGGDPVTAMDETLSKYILFSGSEIEVEITECKIVTEERYRTIVDTSGNEHTTRTLKYIINNATITMNVKRKRQIMNTDLIVSEMIKLRNQNIERLKAEEAKIREFQDSNFNSLSQYSFKRTDPFIWYKSHIRVSFLESPSIKREEIIDFLKNSLDTGYTKKKTKWYKKLIAPVIFIVGVILAVPTGGASLSISLAAIGTFLFVMVLVLTATSALMVAWGDEEGAAANSGFIEFVNKMSTIVNIANIISSTYKSLVSSIQVAGTEGAKEVGKEQLKTAATGATTEAIKTTTVEVAKEYTIETIAKGVKNFIVEKLKSQFTEISFEKALQILNKAFSYYSKYERRKVNKKISSMKSHLEKLEAENLKEDSETQDLALVVMENYTNQLNIDKAELDNYEAIYGPTKRNICKRHFA